MIHGSQVYELVCLKATDRNRNLLWIVIILLAYIAIKNGIYMASGIGGAKIDLVGTTFDFDKKISIRVDSDGSPTFRLSDCLEDIAAHALALASDCHRSAIFFDGHLLKGFQVLLDVGPLEDVTGKVQLSFKLFAKYQGQEAAKDMATNGSIALMKDGAGV